MPVFFVIFEIPKFTNIHQKLKDLRILAPTMTV